MRHIRSAAAAAIVIATAFAAPARASDPEAGSKVFAKCKACHSLVAGKNMIGPSLHALFDRKAGTTKYNYSKAMKEAGDNGLVWNDENLEKYLHSPKEFIKGNKMTFVGLKKDSEIENLLAFLKEATK